MAIDRYKAFDFTKYETPEETDYFLSLRRRVMERLGEVEQQTAQARQAEAEAAELQFQSGSIAETVRKDVFITKAKALQAQANFSRARVNQATLELEFYGKVLNGEIKVTLTKE